jgi:hypothetical protein
MSMFAAPIEPIHHEKMNIIATELDRIFNGTAPPDARQTGFVLLVFPFNGHEGACNYISNGADRRDIIALFKEQIARFEGQPLVSGRA